MKRLLLPMLCLALILSSCGTVATPGETAAPETATPTVTVAPEIATPTVTVAPEIATPTVTDTPAVAETATPEESEPPVQMEDPVALVSNITWIDSDLYAVINLGYRGYSPWEDVLEQSIEIWGLSEPNYYELGGDECYLVIPRYEDTNFAIFESILTEDGQLVEGDLLEDINEGTPFVLFCNPSDLYPNHIIHLTGNQITATFSVSTSLMDGTLNPMEYGVDLSVYLEG